MPCGQRYGCGRVVVSAPRRPVAATTPHPRRIAAMALEPAIQGDVQRETYSWPLSVPRYPVTRNTNSKFESRNKFKSQKKPLRDNRLYHSKTSAYCRWNLCELLIQLDDQYHEPAIRLNFREKRTSCRRRPGSEFS